MIITTQLYTYYKVIAFERYHTIGIHLKFLKSLNSKDVHGISIILNGVLS